MGKLRGINRHPFWVDLQLTGTVIRWVRKDKDAYDHWKRLADRWGDSPRVAAALEDYYSAKLVAVAQDDIQRELVKYALRHVDWRQVAGMLQDALEFVDYKKVSKAFSS